MERVWVRVAYEEDLVTSLSVSVEGHLVALFRTEEGIFALDDICSHEYSRLSEGEVWAGEVYCQKHGSRFNLRTGAVTGLPATLSRCARGARRSKTEGSG